MQVIEKILRYWIENIPPDTRDEYLENLPKYKKLIDRTPDKFLDYHLKDCINKEHYELAQYIKDTARKRGFVLNKQC